MTASQTPILDREVPVPPPVELQHASSPRSPRNKVIGGILVLLFLASIALLDASPRQVARLQAPLFLVLSMLLQLILATFSALVIHELGHLVGGWSMGFRFISVRFGPIEITAPFRLSLSQSRKPRTSGRTEMLPMHASGIRLRLFVMLVGGCVANLLTGFAVPLVPTNSFFLACFSVMSIVMGISNLVPVKGAGFASDGKRILMMLLWPDALVNRRIAMIKIRAELKKGLTAKDIRPDLIAAATSVVDNSIETFLAHRLAYLASWNEGADTEAARLLEIALRYSTLAPPALREALFFDAGCFQASKRQRVELARQWQAEIPETASLPWARRWLEATILETQKDFQGALREVDEIEEIIRKHSEQKLLKSLLRWRSQLLDKVKESQAATTR